MNNLLWFLDHLDPPPDRMHRRGVWSDPDDGMGSLLGSRAMFGPFVRWLEAASRWTVAEPVKVQCFHAVQRRPCEVCADTGTRSGRKFYRWPMAAAIARVHYDLVPDGMPSRSNILFAIACCPKTYDGQGRAKCDLPAVAATLAHRYPLMGDPLIAERAMAEALAHVRYVWREDVPVRGASCVDKPLATGVESVA